MTRGRFCRGVAGVAGSACALLALAAGAACSGDGPPPRSPLGPDTATAAPATSATASATASPTPPSTPTATAPSGGPPVDVDRELAIGKAIERMAQWLGVDQTDLVFASFDEQTFSNACLDVERPGVMCAQVITPGVSVSLLDRVGASHEVRADAALQNFAWSPGATASGRVTAIDQSAGTLTVDAGGTILRLRRAPGTLQDTPFSDLTVGADLSFGFDRSGVEIRPDVLVWIGG